MGRHTLNRERALRYVRRHAWQFHGAGVEDAVRELTPLAQTFKRFANGIKALAPVDTGELRARFGFPEPYGLCPNLAPGLFHQCPGDRPGTPPEGTPETAHGLTVVGWKHPDATGLYYCPDHRCLGGVPVTAADITSPTECWNCGTRLLG